MSSSASNFNYETLKVTKPREDVYQVELNRPEKRNSLISTSWSDIRDCFREIATADDCRAIVLSGAGKLFCAGIDLMDMSQMFTSAPQEMDTSRKAFLMSTFLQICQDSFTAIEKCNKPVITAIHGACIGAGVDLVSAGDIRYCTEDAWFQIKEVDIGLAADVGTLQRFPKVVGSDSLARELAYTARKFYADEAKSCGYVSRIFADRESMIEGALETAQVIASKSPVAIQGTKNSLVFSRDHSVEEGLNHIRVWNQCMLQSEDVMKAAMAAIQKEEATFSKL